MQRSWLGDDAGVTRHYAELEKFALHVGAGLSRSGFTRDELNELLMPAAI